MSLLAVTALSTACTEEKDEPAGAPSIELSAASLDFDIEVGTKTVTVTANRDWKVTIPSDATWLTVDPKSGTASSDPVEVKVSVLENTGLDRETSLVFSIGFDERKLNIKQLGGSGSPEDLIVYYNDFDKEESTKTYGSSKSSWPFLDQFEGWKNATGTGAGSETYEFRGISARNNSNSNGDYSDYKGSGLNNLFFGTNAYFIVKNISLGESTDLALSFGTEKYEGSEADNIFQNKEFHIYLSADAENWVEFTGYEFAGGQTGGRWNIANASLSVPAGTETLSVCFKTDVASVYRLDDLRFTVAEKAGTAVDFSAAAPLDFLEEEGGSDDKPEVGNAIYFNNFDKEESTKTYGPSNNSWPFLDQFEGWKNEQGTGVADVSYGYSATSLRSNSNSDGNYSDYSGSGLNNLFFGTDAYFHVSCINLSGSTNLELSFGTEKYSESGKIFLNSEFHIYLSADAENWVEFTGYEFAGGETQGRWNVASGTFTVPAGVDNLSICFKTDVASAYRMDDLRLAPCESEGTPVDFSSAAPLDFLPSAGGDDPVEELPGAEGNGTVESPYNIAAALNIINSGNIPAQEVYVKGKISSLGSFSSQHGNYTYNLSDDGQAKNEIMVYRGLYFNGDSFTSEDQIKVGDEIVLVGKLTLYNSTPEVNTGSKIISINGEVPQEPEAPAEMTVAEFISAETGTQVILSGIAVGVYGKGFMLSDGTGYALVYENAASTAALGDKVTVTGKKDAYGGLPQVAKLDGYTLVEVVSSGNEYALPEPKVLTGAEVDAYTNTVTELVSFEGTLSISGNYYNVIVDGATRQGSIQNPVAELGLAEFDGKPVKVTGFVTAVNNAKYLNVLAVSVEVSSKPFFSVSVTELKAAASDTEASFDITSNVDWTVVTDNPAYTVEPASGNGDATVTVKFAENAGETAMVEITVATTAEVAEPTYKFVLTHSGADVIPSVVLTFPTDNQTEINVYDKTWDASISGFTWEIANFNNNNNGWTYIKCGRKKNASVAHIATKTPVAFPVAKVVVTVDALSKSDKIKEVYLLVSSKEDYSDTLEKVKVTLAEGENVFTVSSPVADAYYKLVFDCDVAGANGIIQISKVEYAAE